MKSKKPPVSKNLSEAVVCIEPARRFGPEPKNPGSASFVRTQLISITISPRGLDLFVLTKNSRNFPPFQPYKVTYTTHLFIPG